jgi:hypothetical protein
VASLAKVTINWTGFIGAPGYSNLYWRNSTPGVINQAVVDNAASKVDAWIQAWKPMIPNAAVLQTDPTVEEIDDTNGNLVAFWTATTAAAQAGTAGGTVEYAAASGACVNWYTNTVRNSRRIRGRTFMVPLAGAFDTNGTFNTTDLTAMRAAATTLHAATGDARLVVWSRPSAPGATDGQSAEVTFATIPDVGAVLTSRRS